MAQATFSVRMEESLKRQFDALCADFGMTASTAINIFARAVVRERKIPFEIASPETELAKEKAIQAFMAFQTQAMQELPEGAAWDGANAGEGKADQ